MKKVCTILLLTAILTLMGSGLLQAQNNLLPPQRVGFTVGNDNAGSFVDLSWYPANQGQTPTGYYIYIASGQTQDQNQFKQYEKVEYQQNIQEYKKKIYLGAGTYTIFLKSYYIGNGIQQLSNTSNWLIVVIKGDNPDKPYIKIASAPIEYAKPNTLYNYRVKAETNLDANCPLVYRLLEGPKGMTINEKTGDITWNTGGNGEYPVVIEVGTLCKLAVDFAYQKYMLKVGENSNKPYIKIVSQPSPVGYVGKTYIYQLKIETNANCPVKFSVQMQPANIYKFDESSRTLYITVDQPTSVGGVIKAYLECDNNILAYQQFGIRFGQDQPDDRCAKLTGTLVFEDGTIPMEGIARALRITEKSDKYPGYEGKIQQGFFSIPVPEGTYILEVDGMGFVHEFYQDATSITDAQQIVIKCGDSPTFTIAVAKKPEPVKHEVSGRVFDAETNTGLFAMVEFVPVERNNIGANGMGFVTKTDQDGNYSIMLPAEFTYRAHAIPSDRMHLDQWYDQVQSPMEADLIVVEADVEGINFPLKKFNQPEQYGFTGQVVNLSNEPVLAMLQAIPVGQPKMNVKNQGFFSKTNEEGYFTFNNLPLGKYVVLSIPADKMFVPGYYKAGDIATLKWRQATIIEVSEAMPDMIYSIKHRERTGIKGVINLKGDIIATGLTLKNNDVPMGNGIPLAGAFVYTLDEYGQVSDFAFTDVNGHYSLTEIPQGKSMINVDMYGYAEYNKQYDGDYNKSFSSNVDIELEPEAVASVDYLYSNGPVVFPQPANDYIWINGHNLVGQADVIIYDNTGSAVYQMNNVAFNNANNRLEINLATGVYTIVIRDNNGLKTSKLNIVR